jgi:hypothetical protein
MMTALILSDSSTSNQHRSSTHPYDCDETMDMMVHPTPLAMSRMIAQRDDLDDEQETVDTRIPTKPTKKKAITAANLTNSIHHKASLVYSSFPPQKRGDNDLITPHTQSGNSSSKTLRCPLLSYHPSPRLTPRPAKLSRIQSEPATSRRRSIFGHIIQSRNPRLVQSSPDQHDCIRSPPSTDGESSIRTMPVDLVSTLLRPPPTATYGISPHFRTLSELPPDVRESLPCLPTPMKRFYSNQGRKQELAGAYPLNSPKSILRSGCCSCAGPTYGSSSSSSPVQGNGGPQDPTEKAVSLEGGAAGSSDLASTLNLTQTFRRLNMNNNKMDLSREDSDSSITAESTSFSSDVTGNNNICRKHIQFDPRVTVTEYEDSVPRQWVTEFELELYKMETVKLAQQYLVSHPEALATYTTMRLDPVTGTMRRKALFSMPCLSSVGMDEPLDEQQEADKKAAAKMHVKSILLVEQNKFI